MERVELIRECEGVQVPAGNKMMLEKGLEAFITQSLGGTFTLQVPAYGGLFRVAGKDADALGKTPADAGVVAVGVAAGAAACFCSAAVFFSQVSKSALVRTSTTIGMKP